MRHVPGRATAAQIVDAPIFSSPRLAPNGDHVAYVRAVVGSTTVWVDQAQLTDGETDDQPRWHPGGTRLVYRSRRSGLPQLYLQEIAGGPALQLTSDPVGVDRYEWSPRGDRIAFVSRDPEPRDPIIEGQNDPYSRLRMLDLESGTVTTAVSFDAYVGAFSWSPGGDDVAVVLKSDPDLDGRSLPARIVRLDGEILAELPGAPDDIRWLDTGVVYAGTVRMEPCSAGCLYRLDGSRLASGIDDCLVAIVSSEPDELAVTVARGLTTVVLAVDPVSGTTTEIFVPTDGDIGDAHVLGGRWTGVVSSGTEPAAIVHRGSAVTTNPLAAFPWATQEAFTWTGRDGTPLDGLLLRPANAPGRPLPTIVLIHGGGARYTTGFQQPFAGLTNWGQWLATAGYAVVMPNYRGGPGHGDAFEAWRCQWGDAHDDWQDINSAVDAAIQRGVADPDRLGIGGWSAGGYLSAWGITHSDRYRAAVIGAGLSDAGAAMLMTDIPVTMEANLGSRPWDGPAVHPHQLASPITYARSAKTPSLILHGADDVRSPVSQSIGLYRAFRHFGCPTEMVLYPREGHMFRERAHRIDLLERVLDWYGRHV